MVTELIFPFQDPCRLVAVECLGKLLHWCFLRFVMVSYWISLPTRDDPFSCQPQQTRLRCETGNAVFLCISNLWSLWFAFAFPPCIKEGSFARDPHFYVIKLRTAILELLLWHDSSVLNSYENSWAVSFFGNRRYFAALPSINSHCQQVGTAGRCRAHNLGQTEWHHLSLSLSLPISLYPNIYVSMLLLPLCEMK